MVKLLKLGGVITVMLVFLIGIISITLVNVRGVYYAMIYNEPISEWTHNPVNLLGRDIKTAMGEIWHY